MAPRKVQPAAAASAAASTAATVTASKVVGARVDKLKGKGPVRRFENGLLNVDRKGWKYTRAKMHNRQTPLLRLPGEIRNIIWEYALGGHTFKVDYNCELPADITAKVINQPKNSFALLEVCRQIYAETVLLLYQLNTFSFKSSISFTWIRDLIKVRQEAIREIRIVSFYMEFLQEKLDKIPVDQVPGLQRVIIKCRDRDFRLDTLTWGRKQIRLIAAENEFWGDIWKE